MKLRRKITVGLVALVVVCAMLFLGSPNREQKALEETRRVLRQEGFKTDLSDFDFSTSDEMRARAAVLGITTRAALTNRSRPEPVLRETPPFMRSIGSDAAVAVWKLDSLDDYSGRNFWPELRDRLTTNQARIAAAGQAVLAGPIRFEPIELPNALLPYLADIKSHISTFGAEMILALHDGKSDTAWTNLCAATRLVTAYAPEPIDISHLVRSACAVIAYDITWNALQSSNWTDAQLATLQREWESLDFFTALPMTAALSRVNSAAMCRLHRQEPLEVGMAIKEMFRSPRYAWPMLTGQWERIQYRHHGSFDDEKNLLLYYRDREVELRRAVQSPTWADMRQLPGVTNFIPFQSKYRSTIQAMFNQKQLMLRLQGQGQGLLGRVADSEARRRLIITAIALERFRSQHGSYPKTLNELSPGLLKTLLPDFMDGQPMRYRLTDDGHFVLYSVGVDCIDNGGNMPRARQRGAFDAGAPYQGPREFGIRSGTDLVWPRPASATDAASFQQEQLNARREMADRAENFQANEQWRRTARRQADVEKILAMKPQASVKEPTLHGRPLAEILRNESTLGTNQVTLNELLTLKQVVTGGEPEIVTFEVPMVYDVVTNLGSLALFIDPTKDEDSEEGCNVGWLECHRATNGNCLLVWNTIYESPGKHALQMGFALNDPAPGDEEYYIGPPSPFEVSNLCQFSLSSAHFEHDLGAALHAKLPEANGTYSIELKATGGPLVKTFTGSTSNAVIKVHWDLTDDHGNKCTNNSFDSVFRITLPDSGRSQTIKGP